MLRVPLDQYKEQLWGLGLQGPRLKGVNLLRVKSRSAVASGLTSLQIRGSRREPQWHTVESGAGPVRYF